MNYPPVKRVVYADIAKGIGIILVVMEHDHYINQFHTHWQAIILSFHMPLFYFVSGMFFNSSHNFKVHLHRRFHSLLKPYFSVCLLFVGLLFLKNHDVLLFSQNLEGVVYGTGRTLHWPYGQMWFLPSLFWTTISYFFLHNFFLRRFENTMARWSLLLIVLFLGYFINLWFRNNGVLYDLPWSLNLVLITLFFYAAGYEFRYISPAVKKNQNWFVGGALVIVGIYVTGVINEHYFVLNFFYRRYDSIWINTLEAFAAIYLVLHVSRWIEKKYKRVSVVLSYIGNKSLSIFMFHSFVLAYVSGVALRFLDHDGPLRFICTITGTIILCIFAHETLCHFPIFSVLILNTKNKTTFTKGIR